MAQLRLPGARGLFGPAAAASPLTFGVCPSDVLASTPEKATVAVQEAWAPSVYWPRLRGRREALRALHWHNVTLFQLFAHRVARRPRRARRQTPRTTNDDSFGRAAGKERTEDIQAHGLNVGLLCVRVAAAGEGEERGCSFGRCLTCAENMVEQFAGGGPVSRLKARRRSASWAQLLARQIANGCCNEDRGEESEEDEDYEAHDDSSEWG